MRKKASEVPMCLFSIAVCCSLSIWLPKPRPDESGLEMLGNLASSAVFPASVRTCTDMHLLIFGLTDFKKVSKTILCLIWQKKLDESLKNKVLPSNRENFLCMIVKALHKHFHIIFACFQISISWRTKKLNNSNLLIVGL